MDSNQDIRIVLGSKRYEGAPDTNLSIDLSLDQTTKFENEYEAILYCESPEGIKNKRRMIEIKLSIGKPERLKDDS